jgi:hypothetical protein
MRRLGIRILKAICGSKAPEPKPVAQVRRVVHELTGECQQPKRVARVVAGDESRQFINIQ